MISTVSSSSSSSSLNRPPCQYQPKKGKPFCKRLVEQDEDSNFMNYCIIHKPLIGERVLCINCNQMIKKGSTTHAQKCSSFALKITQLPFYHRNCNIPVLNSNTQHTLSLESYPVDENELAARVEALYLKYASEFLDSSLLDTCTTSLNVSTRETVLSDNPLLSTIPSLKHRHQEEAIVQCMEQYGLLNGIPGMYIEFGAGKGRLSKAIGSCVAANSAESCFICIEKSAYKHKAENNEHMQAYRARIDLSDVDLFKLINHTETTVFNTKTEMKIETEPVEEPEVVEHIRRRVDNPECNIGIQHSTPERSTNRNLGVVGIGKHVCGGATDLSLAALKNFLQDSKEMYSENITSSSSSSSLEALTPPQIKGIALALCCHGLCSWDCYVGRPWLESEGNFSAAEFELLRKWGGFFVVDNGQLDVDNTLSILENEGNKSSHHFNSFSSRANLGKMCKRLIDFGRVHYVRSELKMSARLVRFIDASITPENVLLLAWHRPDQTISSLA